MPVNYARIAAALLLIFAVTGCSVQGKNDTFKEVFEQSESVYSGGEAVNSYNRSIISPMHF